MGEPTGERIEGQEVSEAETQELKSRASKFLKETEGVSLELIARRLDDSFTGRIEAGEILSATNLEELQAKAKEQQEARELYGEIMEKIYPQK